MFDVIVIGVGGMGSATLFELARRGLRVLGIDQFGIPNERGSSHGHTRIIRLAYFESPIYVPLLFSSYERWAELERLSGEKLLFKTASIDAGPEASVTVQGSLLASRTYELKHELLDHRAVACRFPGYRLAEGMMAVFQPDGGFLLPERCIENYVNLAKSLGAEVHTNEPVFGWDSRAGEVEVRAAAGTYRARRLVISAGAWARELVPILANAAIPERQVLLWTQPHVPDHFRLDNFPVFNLEAESLRFYGFPSHEGAGFKIGKYHHRKQQGSPEELSRIPIGAVDEDVIRWAIDRFFPEAGGATTSAKTCMFTNSPDEHFILDLHPEFPNVAIAAGFSGHGFKFCSVVGELMADLVMYGGTKYDLGQFSIQRVLSA